MSSFEKSISSYMWHHYWDCLQYIIAMQLFVLFVTSPAKTFTSGQRHVIPQQNIESINLGGIASIVLTTWPDTRHTNVSLQHYIMAV